MLAHPFIPEHFESDSQASKQVMYLFTLPGILSGGQGLLKVEVVSKRHQQFLVVILQQDVQESCVECGKNSVSILLQYMNIHNR